MGRPFGLDGAMICNFRCVLPPMDVTVAMAQAHPCT